MTNEEYQVLYDSIVAVKDKYSAQILAIQGVHSVSVDVFNRKIIVHSDETTPDVRIPLELDSYLVECVYNNKPQLHLTDPDPNNNYNKPVWFALESDVPLRPGRSISRSYMAGSETLGGIWWSNKLQKHVGHTCRHGIQGETFQTQNTNNSLSFEVLSGGVPYAGVEYTDENIINWRKVPSKYMYYLRGTQVYPASWYIPYGEPNGTASLEFISALSGKAGDIVTINAERCGNRLGRTKILFNGVQAKVKSWTSTYYPDPAVFGGWKAVAEVYVPDMPPGPVQVLFEVEGEVIYGPAYGDGGNRDNRTGLPFAEVGNALDHIPLTSVNNYSDSTIFDLIVPMRREYETRPALDFSDQSINCINSVANLGTFCPNRQHHAQGIYRGPYFDGMIVMKTGRTTGTTFAMVQYPSTSAHCEYENSDQQLYLPSPWELVDCIWTYPPTFIESYPPRLIDDGNGGTYEWYDPTKASWSANGTVINGEFKNFQAPFSLPGDSGSAIYTADYADYVAYCNKYGLVVHARPVDLPPDPPAGMLMATNTFGDTNYSGGDKAYYYVDYYDLDLPHLPFLVQEQATAVSTTSLSFGWSGEINASIVSSSSISLSIILGPSNSFHANITSLSSVNILFLLGPSTVFHADIASSSIVSLLIKVDIPILFSANIVSTSKVSLDNIAAYTVKNALPTSLVSYTSPINNSSIDFEMAFYFKETATPLELKVLVSIPSLTVQAGLSIIPSVDMSVYAPINTPVTAYVSDEALLTPSELLALYLSSSSREFEIKAVVGGIIYDDTSVVEFDIEDSIIPSEDFTLGAVISSKLTIKLRTSDAVPSNSSIAPYVRLTGRRGPTEWIELGKYYIDTRGYQDNVWMFTCYDKLILSQQLFVSSLVYPATMADVYAELCGQLALTSDSSVVINPTYMISYKDLDITMHDMLGYIASAHGASVRLTKDTEQINFVKFNPAVTKIPILTSDYFKAQQTNPLKTYTAVCLTYNTDGETLTAGAGDSDHTFNIYNPFMDQGMLNSVLATINGFSYMPFTMDWKGNPTLDIGSAIIVTQRDGTTFPSLVLTNNASYKGGLKASVTAPSYSPQRSETDYKGGLKKYVADQVSKALTPDVPYYGVTIGRAKGLNIKRSDGVSEATFNSDIINMKRNGVNIFDVNDEGWLELTGVKINGGTITWGVNGANPPTAADVGALPVGWNPDLSAYVTSGTLADSLASYLTGANLTTELGKDYIVTGKIAADKIVAGTLTGFTIDGADITASNTMTIQSTTTLGTITTGLYFGNIATGYGNKSSIFGYQNRDGTTSIHVKADDFVQLIAERRIDLMHADGSGCSVTTGDITSSGDISATGKIISAKTITASENINASANLNATNGSMNSNTASVTNNISAGSYTRKDGSLMIISSNCTRIDWNSNQLWMWYGGNIYGVNVAISDASLKRNIIDYSGSSVLDKIMSIKIREFDWIESRGGKHCSIGYIAQELAEIDPDFAFGIAQPNLEDGTPQATLYQPDTNILLPAMVKAMQEMRMELNQLKGA